MGILGKIIDFILGRVPLILCIFLAMFFTMISQQMANVYDPDTLTQYYVRMERKPTVNVDISTRKWLSQNSDIDKENTTDYFMANFRICSCYKAYLSEYRNPFRRIQVCSPANLTYVLQSGARCIHLDVFSTSEEDPSPIVYHGTTTNILSVNYLRFQECCEKISQFQRNERGKKGTKPNSNTNYEPDPLFIALTMHTSNGETIKAVGDCLRDNFPFGLNDSRVPPSLADIRIFLGKVVILSSPLGNSAQTHQTFFQKDMNVKEQYARGKENVAHFDELVWFYWDLNREQTQNDVRRPTNSLSINPAWTYRNFYAVHTDPEETAEEYATQNRNFFSLVAPCNSGAASCMNVDSEDVKRKEAGQRIMDTSPFQNSCQFDMKKVWDSGAQFIMMYLQISDKNVDQYQNNFTEGSVLMKADDKRHNCTQWVFVEGTNCRTLPDYQNSYNQIMRKAGEITGSMVCYTDDDTKTYSGLTDTPETGTTPGGLACLERIEGGASGPFGTYANITETHTSNEAKDIVDNMDHSLHCRLPIIMGQVDTDTGGKEWRELIKHRPSNAEGLPPAEANDKTIYTIE